MLRANKTLYLLIFLFCSGAVAFGQKESSLQLPISIERKGIDIPSILKIIEQKSGLFIAYPGQLIKNQESLGQVKWENKPLEEAIQSLFPQQEIELQLIGKNLLIKAKKKPKKSHGFKLHGYIHDRESGEALIGATLLVRGQDGIGSVSNQYGFYSISLIPGTYELELSYLGYETQEVEIVLAKNLRQDFSLNPSSNTLETVTVNAKIEHAERPNFQSGKHTLNMNLLKQQASLGGEPDLLKAVQNLPGIKVAGEGSNSLYVRGGDLDQNLILLDDAPLYNPSHFLGFLSVFHPDAIRYGEIYKGNFPVQYGGRLSSVLNFRMKEGNLENRQVEGGVGLLASRVMVEGPIKKSQSSFMIAARRSYPDIFFNLLAADDGGNKANFLDLNAKLNFKIDPNNRIYFSAYNGKDVFRFFDTYENLWGNTTASLRWNRIYNENFFGNISLIYNQYQYSIDNFIQGEETFNWESGIRDWSVKADFSYFLNAQNRLRFGTEQILHRFDPGREKQNRLAAVPTRRSWEQAFYLGHEYESPNWTISLGLRASASHNLGREVIYTFDAASDLLSAEQSSSGIYHSEFQLEPRVHFNYHPQKDWSLQLGYSRNAQYQLELRNSISGFSAFYAYLPSNVNIPAQVADQVNLGFFKSFPKNGWHFSSELYYKWLHNQVDFVPGTSLLQNPLVEGNLRFGRGYAYGFELLIEKNKECLNASLSYNYSRSFRQIAALNEGKSYPTYFDQPHAVQLNLQCQANERWLLGINWRYNTGNATTLPIGSFQFDNTIVPIYGERNAQRLPDYHRLDLSATLFRKKRAGQKNESYWVFGLYNAYYRQNALSIDILPRKEAGTDNVPDPLDVRAFKTFIFGPIPSVSYHFKF